MLNLSKRALEIRPSPTMAMSALASEMKRVGRDVIPLSLGEPDFHTPDNIKSAGIAAIKGNFTKYTAVDGFGPLKSAIAAKLLQQNGTNYSTNEIVVGSGAKIVIYAALLGVVNPGDEVVIPAPYWVTYPDQVELLGGVPVIAIGEEATGFKITPQTLARALSPRTRAIIFNSPSNPSGAVYTKDEIRALAEVLVDHPGVWIISDELYEHLVFDGRTAISFVQAVPEFQNRIIVINGFSKGYVMTGWRLAFAAGPKDVIKAMSDLLSQMTGSPNSIAQAAGIEALEGDQSFMEENRKRFQERRDLVVDCINRIPGLGCLKPAGTFYAYANCGGWLGSTSKGGRKLVSDLDVVEALLDESGLAAVPGQVFGLSPFFRVSISLDESMLRSAMDRLEEFGKSLRWG